MNSGETIPTTAWLSPLDAIILSGTDSNPKRMVQGRNKAFLEVGGEVLVRRVAETLLNASSIGFVFVVGPAEPLRKALDGLTDQVVIVDQVGKMLANTWAAIHASEARCLTGENGVDPERPLLIISCDLPLISPTAVDDFVARCAQAENAAQTHFSLFGGVVEEASLRRYYPQEGKPGIRRPYVHFSHELLRLANIYVARPRKLSHQEFLQTGFSYRKARNWRNVMSLVRSYLGWSGGWKAAWLTLRLQATLMASRRGGKLYRWLREGNSLERVELAMGALLGGTVKMIITPYGGFSLDVDDEEDFRVLNQRFDDWSSM
ncbi:MAG: nucleotidyltransferase family protein [Xanthomonadales bacterium]